MRSSLPTQRPKGTHYVRRQLTTPYSRLAMKRSFHLKLVQVYLSSSESQRLFLRPSSLYLFMVWLPRNSKTNVLCINDLRKLGMALNLRANLVQLSQYPPPRVKQRISLALTVSRHHSISRGSYTRVYAIIASPSAGQPPSAADECSTTPATKRNSTAQTSASPTMHPIMIAQSTKIVNEKANDQP